MKKTRVHIIHHTHWDMEWYFTTHDTNALLNYTFKDILNKLEENKDETFLFDGQLAPFEEISKHPKLFKRFQKLVKNNQLRVGPWYSQPDLRLTSDEGIFRNYHYGQNIAGLQTNKYNYLYTPDTFGFGENIPSIYHSLNKKYSVLWRGVNRKELNDAPIFKWRAKNGHSTIVYNIGSGYFVGRYLYSDKSLDTLYKNNILPSISRQTQNGKYSVVAIPSGGDQQPYNFDLKNGIKKLNAKNDGNEYILSTWEQFFKELEPEIKNTPEYKGSHTLAYGGRLHKLVGSHRPDIKKLIYTNEMKISRVLEPLLLMSSLSKENYPEVEIDKMWKNILLSQAHDAYASCNSDQVNTNIKNRLLDSQNIYKSNKDMIIRFISQNYKNESILIFNPTQYSGKNVFELEVATNKPFFEIKDNKESIDYIILSQEKNKGGLKVIYTADGEIENRLPDIFVTKIKLFTEVKKTSIKSLEIISKDKKQSSKKYNNNIKYQNNKFILSKNKNKTEMDILFKLDGGDSYDLDLYDSVKGLSLKDAKINHISEEHSGNVSIIKYNLKIKVPNSINNWKKQKTEQEINGEIVFTISNRINISYKFNNLSKNLLIQPTFSQKHTSDEHIVLSQNGYINRKNKVEVDEKEIAKLRESPSNFDLMHGNIIIGEKNKLSIFSLDVREYKIEDNLITFNLLRTPDVLGRENLKIRPGRASGLSDKTVFIPKSTSEINNEKFEINLDFNLSDEELAHVIDEIVIKDLAIHKQDIYKYYSNVNGWTLPKLKTNKKLDNIIKISNKNIILQALFKSRGNYYIRINNPLQIDLKTNIKYFNKEQKNITIKSNESKTYKIKA